MKTMKTIERQTHPTYSDASRESPASQRQSRLMVPLGELILPQAAQVLEQEFRDLPARVRGDRQLPDEPNRGFRIEHLESPTKHGPLPEREILPSFRSEDFVDQVMDGRTPIRIVRNSQAIKDGFPSFLVYFKIPASKYQEAVAEGKVQADLFGTEGKVSHTAPGAEALEGLVDDSKKRETLKPYFEQQARRVQRNYVDDLENLESESLKELEGIFEAYEFADGDRTIRLLNHTRTALSEEQLRQAANVIRSFSDKSGGELFDRLHTIHILPEYNSKMLKKVADEEGEFQAPHAGEAKNGSLFISERAIQRPEDRKPRSERIERYWTNQYNKRLLPGESADGPDRPYHNASRFDWEILLAHELEHISLPANSVELPGPGTTLYSRFNKREHEAELGALEYKGGEEALAVPLAQRRAKLEMWQQRRGSKDGGLTYQQPQGPRFVVCRELDLTKGPLPVRLRYPGSPLPVEINYRLVPGA